MTGPRQYALYLLGYDFDTKTEKVLIDSVNGLSSSTISWAPNDEEMAVFTQNGLEIVKVDGTRNKILDYYVVSPSALSAISHKWIPRLN